MQYSILNSEFIFWTAWVIIPLLVEIIPAMGCFLVLLLKYVRRKRKKEYIEYYPEITIIIPVYNSADTLRKCIRSVFESDYDKDLINVMLVDNGSTDASFSVFQECQKEFPSLNMTWMTSNQGKSRALNKAIFNVSGKYVINIDSDGRLEKNALKNVVLRFENDLDIHCVTGVILTENSEIEQTKDPLLKHIRRLEFIEYCHVFLAGRNFHSEFNSLFTISGAFSAFRKSTLVQTFLYNTDTICEDAHITFQIKKQGKKVALCENAFFYVSPIDDLNKLYTQRQRWQIGELEVFHMFFKKKMHLWEIIKNSSLRILLFDHTFSFPRFIWYAALAAIVFLNYTLQSTMVALLLLYLLYGFTGFLFSIVVNQFLKDFPEDKKYYNSRLPYVALYPLYNMGTFFIRLAGIINSITRNSSWKTYTFSEELAVIKDIIKKDFF